jgi:hypothetical protein
MNSILWDSIPEVCHRFHVDSEVYSYTYHATGISYSTPTISFFTSDAERRFLIPSATTIPYPSLNASSNALGTVWAQNQLLGKLALARDTDDILQHMSTDNIARDMLCITEAFGSEKLQYWGIS